jgi:hypothetical protein
MNWVYHLSLVRAIQKAPEASQRLILGCTAKDIEAGQQALPKGFRGAAESAGRWIEAGGDPAAAVDIVADARQRGISFGDITTHFRSLRIGEREGSALSLTRTLARTLDEYQKRFPKTTDDQRIGAVRSLLSILEKETPEKVATF